MTKDRLEIQLERKLVLEYREGNSERELGSYVIFGEGDWKGFSIETKLTSPDKGKGIGHGVFFERPLSDSGFAYRSIVRVNGGHYLVWESRSEFNLGALPDNSVRDDKSDADGLAYERAKKKFVDLATNLGEYIGKHCKGYSFSSENREEEQKADLIEPPLEETGVEA